MHESTNGGTIVSDPAEMLILVDENDREIGSLSKAECHVGDGRLHRAFSVFLFNSRNQLLMQKRSAGKPLWPLYWSNTCCSHPRRGESMEPAIGRRLREELGIVCEVSFLFKFEYQARFGDVGAEHEICHVYSGRYAGRIEPNPTEVAETRFFDPEAIDIELDRRPDMFTPWFKLEWQMFRQSGRASSARSRPTTGGRQARWSTHDG